MCKVEDQGTISPCLRGTPRFAGSVHPYSIAVIDYAESLRKSVFCEHCQKGKWCPHARMVCAAQAREQLLRKVFVTFRDSHAWEFGELGSRMLGKCSNK